MSLTKQEADALIDTIRGFVDKGQGAQRAVDLTLADKAGSLKAGQRTAGTVTGTALVALAADGNGNTGLTADQIERLYQIFKARFIDDAKVDPVLLHLVTTRPEMILEFERKIVSLDAKSMKGRVAQLIASGWFKDIRATSAVRRELARIGSDPGGGGTLSDQLSSLQRDGFLTREGDGWQVAAGIKITDKQLETA